MFTLTDGVIVNSNPLLTSGWYIRQALEVWKDQALVRLWTVEINTPSSYHTRFRIYTLLSKNNITEITETVYVNVPNVLITTCTNSAEFDELETVLLSCTKFGDVYLFNTVSGAYLRSVSVMSTPASYVGVDDSPECLAIDRHAGGQVFLFIFRVKKIVL